ncbi:MAG: exopolysaccharide biosynthesis polyprenyl glycosylphosphotransferase [Candidatus Paceibacterota bacterium]
MKPTKDSVILFFGDILVFFVSLWLTLVIRHFSVPSTTLFFEHLVPFAILFGVWVVVFFIAGLYERRSVLFQTELPSLLLKTQFVNIGLAVLFFYAVPYFTITPKTNLFIYLVVSFGFILAWRLYGHGFLGPRRKYKAVIIGSGEETEELVEEVNNGSHLDFTFLFTVDLNELDGLDIQTDIIERIYSEDVRVIVVDLRHPGIEPLLPHLYNLIFSRVRFFDMHHMYQEAFARVPLSLVHYNWFLENVSASPRAVYDSFKRLMDILLAGTAGVLSLVLYPLVILAIKLEDGGPAFIHQERIGKNNQRIRILKFRTMTTDDGGIEDKKKGNRVTRVGRFLRKTRIDELPQLWNVLSGSLSLIGPRPELPSLVKGYEEGIPYYDVRHLIKPGLSGWAQIYHRTPPRRDLNLPEAKRKLSYDLYYIINRSPMLDLSIALKTLKTLASRSGS